MNRAPGNSLAPADALAGRLVVFQDTASHRALTDSYQRPGQIWDPTLGAFRAQRLPIALSKSSMATQILTDSAERRQSRRSSASSYTSATSSLGSSATDYSYSSAQSLPRSLVSRPSSYSFTVKTASKGAKLGYFKALPPEVYDCILQHLRQFHEDPRSQSCQACYLRDLCSLSLTNRAWDKAVIKRLLVLLKTHIPGRVAC